MSTTTTGTVPSSGTWTIDGVHSSASFKVTHLQIATFRGGFHNPAGSLTEGVLSGSVELENLDVGLLPVFKEHLHAPDWFDAANHPTISFRSSALKADDGGTVTGAGELTIKGVTKPVQFTGRARGPVEVDRPDGAKQERLGLDLSTTIDRREFGVEASGGADWNVTLEVSLALAAE